MSSSHHQRCSHPTSVFWPQTRLWLQIIKWSPPLPAWKLFSSAAGRVILSKCISDSDTPKPNLPSFSHTWDVIPCPSMDHPQFLPYSLPPSLCPKHAYSLCTVLEAARSCLTGSSSPRHISSAPAQKLTYYLLHRSVLPLPASLLCFYS